jgi:hypothetical protein
LVAKLFEHDRYNNAGSGKNVPYLRPENLPGLALVSLTLGQQTLPDLATMSLT